VTGFVGTISDLIPVGVNRNVILLGCNFDGSVSSVSDAFDAIRQRKKFIQSCPNLESLKDETRELGDIMDMTLPSTLSTLFVHLKIGKAPAKPIKAPGLSSLVITADLTLRESPYNFEMSNTHPRCWTCVETSSDWITSACSCRDCESIRFLTDFPSRSETRSRTCSLPL
jgi:hypothetical protein